MNFREEVSVSRTEAQSLTNLSSVSSAIDSGAGDESPTPPMLESQCTPSAPEIQEEENTVKPSQAAVIGEGVPASRETPFGGFQVIRGDCRAELRKLPEASVHVAITSPPYYGLRDYGIEPSIWGGSIPGCRHFWQSATWSDARHTPGAGPKQATNGGSEGWRSEPRQSDTCERCGAWRGCLGLEPTIDLFVSHLVEVMREVRNVLRPDGTLWLNLGDSYMTKPTNHGSSFDAKYLRGRDRSAGPRANRTDHPEDCGEGLKSKDLVLAPFRVLLALQADGWYVRSIIPWAKRSAMPSSQRDRPTTAIEWVFQLTKGPDCYYDPEAVRIESSGTAHARGNGVNPKAKMPGPGSRMRRDRDPSHQTEAKIRNKQNRSFSAAVASLTATRMRRDSDWLFESLSGLLLNEHAEPLSLIVNPQAFSLEMCAACETCYEQKEYRKLEQREAEGVGPVRVCRCGAWDWVSHFATFPESLVRPLILASTSEAGACHHCGAPYRRILERQKVGDWHPDPAHKHDNGAKNGTAKWAKDARQVGAQNGNKPHAINGGGSHTQVFAPPQTPGWEPSCSHPLFPSIPVPCVVLDPFSGSGRTGLAAVKLGRNYLGIERNPRYAKMSEFLFERLTTPSDGTAGRPEESSITTV